jgi:hypothetical protein
MKILEKAFKFVQIMKKYLLLVLIFAGTAFISYAQPAEQLKKLEAIQIAFLTKELNLTTDEAQKFWPVYNNYRSELLKVVKDNRDADVLEKDELVLNIRKKYKPEFKKVLSSDDRVNKIFKVEVAFKQMLKKELQNRQQNRRFGPQGGGRQRQ